MEKSRLETLEVASHRQLKSPSGSVNRASWWAALVLLLGLLFGLVWAKGQLSSFRSQTLSGRVVLMNSRVPVRDAMISVESTIRGSDGAFGRYVKSNEDGRFVAEIRGFPVSIGVWKQGYALNGVIVEADSLKNEQEVVVQLREMTPTNWVVEKENREGLGNDDGFSFSLGKVVESNSFEADIVLDYRATGSATIVISAKGEGGLSYQPDNEKSDFYNTPEAPITGYSPQIDHKREESGVYYLRTHDGKHYAKFRLKPGFKGTDKGSDFSFFWIQWAYQQDGTRNLEVSPSKSLSFPIEEFGLKRDSLN